MDQTIGRMIQRRIAESPNKPAIRAKVGSAWKDLSNAEMGARLERIAAGLMTIPGGLQATDAVTILGSTSADWILCDFALLSIGVRTVPVYATLLAEECGYLHVDTDSVLAICENAEQLEKVRALKRGFHFFDQDYGPERVKVRHMVVMDTTGLAPADDWESLADVEARGAAKLAETADARREWAERPTRDDHCTYTYTSGTTGPPKGVIQTHGNMLSLLENIATTGLFREEVQVNGLFLFLPLAHSFGRLIEFAGPYFDTPIVVSSIPTLIDDLTATRPGFFPAAPRVYEKMKAKIEGKVAGAPPIRQKLFHAAMNAGRATIPYRSKGQPLPFGVKLRYNLANKVVLSKLRAALGFDRAGVLLSGSAPLDTQVHEFFLAMGADLLEAYGLTETCPGLTGNLPGKFKLGTVGPPLPGVTIKIADDGEILAKGPNITSGYLNRPEATAEAFNEEGWFMTGDLGSRDEEGFIKITGRKKELMKTSGGKYIAPAKLEGRLKNHTLIQEAVTIADLRNYVTAIIAIDPEELEAWATQRGLKGVSYDSSEVRDEVQRHIDAVNETLARYETVKKFTLVPPMTTESGLLTASLKVKRKLVYERYAAAIETMYAA